MQLHRATIPIPKGKNRKITREDWTKVWLKPSRENTRSCSSGTHIQGSPTVLGIPILWMCSLQGLSSVLPPLIACGRCSMFLAPSTFWSLHCNLGFTITASCTALSWTAFREDNVWPCHTLPGPPCFPLKSGWKLPWTYSSFICLLSFSWKHLFFWRKQSITTLSTW
jgi:hypothetical protein